MEDAGLSHVQGVNTARLSNRAECARAPGLAKLATPRYGAPRDSAMGRGQVSSRHGLANGPECLGTALQHSRSGGRIRISPNESRARREVRAEGSEEEARADRR